MSGDHSGHDGKHHGLPGLIGGSICVCQGDCAERFTVRMERIFGPIRDALEAERGEAS